MTSRTSRSGCPPIKKSKNKILLLAGGLGGAGTEEEEEEEQPRTLFGTPSTAGGAKPATTAKGVGLNSMFEQISEAFGGVNATTGLVS